MSLPLGWRTLAKSLPMGTRMKALLRFTALLDLEGGCWPGTWHLVELNLDGTDLLLLEMENECSFGWHWILYRSLKANNKKHMIGCRSHHLEPLWWFASLLLNMASRLWMRSSLCAKKVGFVFWPGLFKTLLSSRESWVILLSSVHCWNHLAWNFFCCYWFKYWITML